MMAKAMHDGMATAAARAPTDGESILRLLDEVKSLRREAEALRAAYAQSERYLRLVERFMALAEGRHLQNQNMMAEEPYPRDGKDRLLDRLEEFAKALDVEDTLKRKADEEATDGGGS